MGGAGRDGDRLSLKKVSRLSLVVCLDIWIICKLYVGLYMEEADTGRCLASGVWDRPSSPAGPVPCAFLGLDAVLLLRQPVTR